ncbi:MAG TPA: hypothetical protein VH442_21405 [Micromonosporaceae bacterium]|jgi:hypothetical protein
MFGRHSSTDTAPNGTPVDGRDEAMAPADADVTEVRRHSTAPTTSAADADTERVPRGRIWGNRRGMTPAVGPAGGAAVATRPVGTEPVDDATGEPVVSEPVVEPVETVRRQHVSGAATLSLIIGTLAIAATLTGLLAPIGFAAGILAVLVGIAALYAVRRPAVTGHTLVGLGVLFGLVAIVLSVLAMGGSVSWLSNKSDEINTVHNWLNDHMHWLRRW